jgi:hypothetical protein
MGTASFPLLAFLLIRSCCPPATGPAISAWLKALDLMTLVIGLTYNRDWELWGARMSDVSPAERRTREMDPLRWQETSRDRDARLARDSFAPVLRSE